MRNSNLFHNYSSRLIWFLIKYNLVYMIFALMDFLKLEDYKTRPKNSRKHLHFPKLCYNGVKIRRAMDQNPEMQGDKSPKAKADLANDTPADQASTQTTTVVETVTTKTEEPVATNGTVDTTRPMATEIITETVTETNAKQSTTQSAKKKSRKGLIALIVTLLIIILAAAGAAIWYFVFYSNPERVVFDAVDGFLKRDTIVSEGIVNGEVKLSSNKILIVAGLNSKSAGISSENTIDTKVSFLDEDGELLSEHQYELEASGIMMKDGVIYFRIGKLLETFEAALDDASIDLEDLNDDMLAVREIIEEVDNEWWQVNVPDIIDEIVSDPEEAQSSKDFYACLIDVANSGSAKKDVIAAYEQNRFFNIGKATAQGNVTEYDVSLDYEKLANFYNTMTDSETSHEIKNCAKKLKGVSDAEIDAENDPVTVADLEANFRNIDSFTLTISNLGHELKGISYEISDKDEVKFVGAFSFEHPAVTIESPESYRPVSELVEQIVAIVTEIVNANEELDDYSDYEYDPETGISHSTEEPWVQWNDNDLPINGGGDWNA